MLRSMTAFSRVKKIFKNIEISVDIQSHNKRHMDIQLKLPPEFALFDTHVRKLLSQEIARGCLVVTVQAYFTSEHPATVHFNMPLAKKIQEALLPFAKEIGCPKLSFQDLLPVLLNERGIIQISSEVAGVEMHQGALEEVVSLAIGALIKMKEREGKLIQDEFKGRLKVLEEVIISISALAKDVCHKLRIKLSELLIGLFPGKQDADERLLKEVAILADKVDIAEEISRFNHHLAHFHEVLEKEKEATGKVFEFILQELQREINTIGSKSQDARISTLVIEAKSEIEKIREQVQNVE